jgi:hypothetical protein
MVKTRAQLVYNQVTANPINPRIIADGNLIFGTGWQTAKTDSTDEFPIVASKFKQ